MAHRQGNRSGARGGHGSGSRRGGPSGRPDAGKSVLSSREELSSPAQRRRSAVERRRRRRREQQLQRLLWLGIGAVVVVFAVAFYLKNRKPPAPAVDQSIIAVHGEQESLTKEEEIRQNPGDYTPSLVELLDRNPETVDFIYDYPTEHRIKHEIDLSEQVAREDIPLFIQWDERWGYETYGSDMIAITGCGPTCLSMVLCAVRGDAKYTPLKVAQYADRNGYYTEGSGTAWNLMDKGAKDLGLSPKGVGLSDGLIRRELEAGNLIICSMGPGDFTDAGHYIILVGVNENGTIEIRDPNSPKHRKKNWDLKVLMKQMKNLWAYERG